MAKNSSAVIALDYLLAPEASELGSLVVVAGDEPFLKREVMQSVRGRLSADNELACSVFAGRECDWRDVSDSLTSVSLFGGASAAVVEDADTFVTRYRPQLEDYAAKEKHPGTLVLDVKQWPGNTRLAKAHAGKGALIKCQIPDRGAELGAFQRSAKKWLAQRAESTHEASIDAGALDALFDLLPLSLGVMDQEVSKLALLASETKRIDAALVRAHVGGWRTRKTWDMIDAIADGDARGAIEQLDRLLRAGEQPIGLMAQVGSSLRKFSAAACLIEQAEAAGRRTSLRDALERAGIMRFKLTDAERQLKQIGRGRAAQLDQWLLDSDLALKGHNSTANRARTELERLIVRLSKAADERRAG
ncbi:DNA polymerase III subunit delta [Posidoniimonas polymericola]|uniref:DNA polymerase III subunit delta n=1 Tax=Posidoniimonas polymericola TaxID=2528002 RepID=UPI0018D37553|nr:DNA polymerase III subunit delta [Posidoniimonas polymericola]